jgi:HD-GYP domain-containing protein (c-di-GMP phosphodiesterase class II)
VHSLNQPAHRPERRDLCEGDALLLALGGVADRLGRGDGPSSRKTLRAAWLSARLAEQLGLPESLRAEAIRAALLHHLAADDLRNELTAQAPIASHSRHGLAVSSALAPFQELRGVANAAAHHEANWDGSGSPGLAGEAIPLAAQLVRAGDLLDSALELSRQGPDRIEVALVADLLGSMAGRELSAQVAIASVAVLGGAAVADLNDPTAAVRAALLQLPPLLVSGRELLCALAPCAEARNPYSKDHSVRTALRAKAIARTLGLDVATVDRLEMASWAHDIGELIVPAQVFQHPDLPASLRLAIQGHPAASAKFCSEVPWLAGVAPIVLAHHERFDGTGYPSHRLAAAIPLEARILAVADTVDAMRSEQVYRDGLAHREIASALCSAATGAFDSEIVDAALASVGAAQ